MSLSLQRTQAHQTVQKRRCAEKSKTKVTVTNMHLNWIQLCDTKCCESNTISTRNSICALNIKNTLREEERHKHYFGNTQCWDFTANSREKEEKILSKKEQGAKEERKKNSKLRKQWWKYKRRLNIWKKRSHTRQRSSVCCDVVQ